MEENSKTSRFRMMVEDLLPRLRAQDSRLARWMLENEQLINTMPIKEIAAQSGVSQPTVVRFCKKLGCNGTKDLKVLVDSTKGSRGTTEPCIFDDSSREIFRKIFSLSIESLEISFAESNWQEIESLASRLLDASGIFIFGVGGSAVGAGYLSQELMRLGLRNMCFTEPYSILTGATNFKEGDVLVFVSRRGETESLLAAAKRAQNTGAFISCITTKSTSALAGLSDLKLAVFEKQYLMDDENSFSHLGEMALISILYIMCAKKLGERDSEFRRNYLGITNYKKDIMGENRNVHRS